MRTNTIETEELAMARDRTARRRIQEYLLSSGPVVDPSGYATGLLREAVSYSGSPVAFIQLVAAMERDGELRRETRGKRTYEIGSTVSTQTPSDSNDPYAAFMAARVGFDFDYNRFARAVVRELLAAAISPTNRETSSAPVEASHDAIVAERDEYGRRLELARTSLDQLLRSVESATREHSQDPAASR